MQDLPVHQHAPGQVGRLAPELAVDEVADAAGEQTDRRQGRHEVEHVGDAAAAAPGEERDRDHHAGEAAVEGHAALPDTERSRAGPRTDRIEAVDQNPAEAPAGDHADRSEENQVVDVHRLPGRPGSGCAPAREPPAGDEADHVHEPVPVHLDRAERKRDRIDFGIGDHRVGHPEQEGAEIAGLVDRRMHRMIRRLRRPTPISCANRPRWRAARCTASTSSPGAR